jgi:hypothetical protein
MNIQYPLNPRDEDQPVLPQGNKSLFITLSIFFVLIISTVILLNYATAKDVQYSNLESGAANPTEGVIADTQFVVTTEVPVEDTKPIPEKLSAFERKLDIIMKEHTLIPALPSVDLGS